MKTIQILFISLIIACATSQHKRQLNRTISSVQNHEIEKQLKNKNAGQRIITLEKNLKALYEKMPHKGNPRFYLFEYFYNKSMPIIQDTKELQHLLEEDIFVPKITSARNNLMKLVYYYKVMHEAGIYLNFSQIIVQETDNVNKLLASLDYIVKQYDREINSQYNLGFFPEKKFNLKSHYRLELIRFLLNKISINLEVFIKDTGELESIQNIFSAIKNISYSDKDQLNQTFNELLTSTSYQKIKAKLSDLNLPDSGDIDGHEQSFETVMSVQLSFELINFIIKRQLRDKI